MLLLSTLFPFICTWILNLSIPQHTKTYQNLSPFHQITIDGNFKTKVEQGNKYNVTLVGEESIVEQLLVQVSGKQLMLNTPKNPKNSFSEIEVTVTTPDLSQLVINGASIVQISNFSVSDLQMEINGASVVQAEVQAKKLDITLSGASSLSASGKAVVVHTLLSGASVLKGYELEVENLKTEMSGASKVQMTVSKVLEAALSGATKLQYKGSPSIKKQQVSGAAKLEQIK